MLIALILGIPVILEYSKTGLVPRFPTLIVAGFFSAFALQTFVCGLILDTQGKSSRQHFEIQLNVLTEIDRIKTDIESNRN